jgi:NAD-reducing hydrogenase small subunit
MTKPRIATAALSGCFGCHMSLLDIDERLLQLIEVVDFDCSPINDFKDFRGRCDVGLVEGACATEENVAVLRRFREMCDVLVSVGECAIAGGICAMRNPLSLVECFDEAYRHGPTVYNPQDRVPDDVELPLLLDHIVPCHEVVEIDHFIPGCPPRADALWTVLNQLLGGRAVDLPSELIRYD